FDGWDQGVPAGEGFLVTQYRADVGIAREHPEPVEFRGPEHRFVAEAVECDERVDAQRGILVVVEVPDRDIEIGAGRAHRELTLHSNSTNQAGVTRGSVRA